jgi:hypothetical protein
MLRFSDIGNTEAWATRRRISRPAAGLAIIPTELEKLLKVAPKIKTYNYIICIQQIIRLWPKKQNNL